jgi:hypothetical protein
MFRSHRRLPAGLGLLTGVVFVLSACGGGPTLPALTDPNEIITAALTSTEGAKSVHVDVTLDGSLSLDLMGTGNAAPLSLTGTSASADFDMALGKARVTFAVPALLNLNGELIQIGETSYVKSSMTGPQYVASSATDSLPIDPTDASGLFDDVGDLLTADGVDPVKGDDVDCGGKQCYTVMVELTPDELAGLGADQIPTGDLPIDVGVASVAFTVRVEKDTYRLAGISATASLGDEGSLTLDLTMSKWDQPTDISPPPADQVKTTS